MPASDIPSRHPETLLLEYLEHEEGRKCFLAELCSFEHNARGWEYIVDIPLSICLFRILLLDHSLSDI